MTAPVCDPLCSKQRVFRDVSQQIVAVQTGGSVYLHWRDVAAKSDGAARTIELGLRQDDVLVAAPMVLTLDGAEQIALWMLDQVDLLRKRREERHAQHLRASHHD